MKGIGHFFHNIKFDGKVENEEVLNLREEIKILEEEIKKKLARIEEIQNDCDHTYHLVRECVGYEDDYCCSECGKEEEH